MPTLLAIEVSPRHGFSTSRTLTAHFIDAWKAAHPGSTVVVRDLMKTPPPFVDHAWIGGAFTPREQHSAVLATGAICRALNAGTRQSPPIRPSPRPIIRDR